LFIWEDAFGMAEGIVMKHFKDYDHFGINDIPKEIGTLISSEWLQIASTLKSAEEAEYHELLNLDVVYHTYIITEFSENNESIINLLIELSKSFKQFYKAEKWVCILGQAPRNVADNKTMYSDSQKLRRAFLSLLLLIVGELKVKYCFCDLSSTGMMEYLECSIKILAYIYAFLPFFALRF